MTARPRARRPRRVLVLLSGGIDSAVAALLARDEGCVLHFLTFDYQQRNSRELECARRIARAVCPGAPHDVVRLDFAAIGRCRRSGLLVPEPAPEPNARARVVESQTRPVVSALAAAPEYGFYVPGRNMIFLSHAVALAEVEQLEEIHMASHLQDVTGPAGQTYPDTGEAFLHRAQELLNAGLKYGGPVRLMAPLLALNKFELIRFGHDRGFDFSLTWTCYTEGPQACGECPACRTRLVSFLWAGLVDPIPYRIPQVRALAQTLDVFVAQGSPPASAAR